jgi:hypothetical protein
LASLNCTAIAVLPLAAANRIALMKPAVFRNNIAAWLWAFALCFLLFNAAMTYVLLRDGSPPGYSSLVVQAIMALFWVCSLGLAAYAASVFCLRITVQSGADVMVVWRYPFNSIRLSVACSSLTAAQVIEGKSSDGDPYFHAQCILPGGRQISLAEGQSREWCEAECARFNAGIGQA